MVDEILMQSVLDKESEPWVQLKWGDRAGQLSVKDARAHAMLLMECAERAVNDSLLLRWLMESMELDRPAAMQALQDLRKFRGEGPRADWRG